MSNSRKIILVDCERMKYPYTGLYNFCLHLSQGLITTNSSIALCFYAPHSAAAAIGSIPCFIQQKTIHKIFFPSTKNVGLWHCTHQASDYFPYGRNVKKLLTIHDLNYLNDESKTSRKKAAYRHAVQKKIDAADHIVAISGFTLQQVQQQFNLGNKPASVIYNGCNIGTSGPLISPAYRPASPFLYSIGTITEKKNFHVLPSLLQQNDFELVISGITQRAAYKERILREAAAIGVQDRIHFTGPVSENDKQWYMKHCTAFLFPSIAEGFGLPVVEAMHFGRPVFLSRYTSLPEIGSNAAYYFNSFEASEMRQAFELGMKDYESDKSRKVQLMQRAAFFSWENSARSYHEIYAGLMQY